MCSFLAGQLSCFVMLQLLPWLLVFLWHTVGIAGTTLVSLIAAVFHVTGVAHGLVVLAFTISCH